MIRITAAENNTKCSESGELDTIRRVIGKSVLLHEGLMSTYINHRVDLAPALANCQQLSHSGVL
jgi:hypothetical protein